jgi:hypothetical protein
MIKKIDRVARNRIPKLCKRCETIGLYSRTDTKCNLILGKINGIKVRCKGELEFITN